MKKIKFILQLIVAGFAASIIIQSCASSKEMIANKSGAQLWGENCIRCHNIPSPVDFSDEQWNTIGLHMQVRANLTKDETEKIIGFLKTAN
mgnify:CR=1 FL=1